MLIELLQINADGTQQIVQKEVPDNWNDVSKSQAEQIAALKTQLSDTDYKIIKCSEYQLAGLDAPYDIAALHTERQATRDAITALGG